MYNIQKGTIKSSVLGYLYQYGANSRKKIAQGLNVTTATVSIVTNELIESGILLEVGEISAHKAGRREVLVDINPDKGYALGLELQNKKVIFGIIDLKCNVVDSKKWSLNKKIDRNTFIEILSLIKNMIKGKEDKILGIGVLVPGVIKNNIPLNAPLPTITEDIKEILNLECILENNIHGIVLSEFYSQEHYKNFWLLRYGPGVGSAVVIDKQILKRHDGQEIGFGHVPIFSKDNGQYCEKCHYTGCLESHVHFDRIVENYEKQGYVKDNESTLEFIKRVSETEGYNLLHANLKLLAEQFMVAYSMIPTKEVILTGDIFSDDRLFQYFKSQINITNVNIQYMKNYSCKRTKAGAVIILDQIFDIASV